MNNKTEVTLLVDKVKERIVEFKKSTVEVDNVTRNDLCAIEIAACLLELKEVCNRSIKSEEMYWFQGERFIEDSFRNDKEYSDLYYNYMKIKSFIK
ncbi:hypothetical protein KJK34_08415 [Flavobacterium sp. D11R37]|uniref:hypothetical protein n=1 Tax=Flavobacterium coralii TaxID=2838017 RepID=UPI001CA76557|nr:hypothetical protein [Flavobacterium coralii]MBY8962769.1 hypothetical protein [Flavobacterium coralii]